MKKLLTFLFVALLAPLAFAQTGGNRTVGFGSGGGTTSIDSGTTPITGGGTTQVCFNDASVISCGHAGLTYVKATQILTVLGGETIGSTTTAGTATTNFLAAITGGAGSNFFSIAGTFPTVMTATTNALNFTLTGAGSSAQLFRGLNLSIAAGYTGTSGNIAGRFENLMGSAGGVFSGVDGPGQIGIQGTASGVGSNYNVGVLGYGNSSTSTGMGGVFIGNYGGLAAVYSTTGAYALGSQNNYALSADNKSNAVGIFCAADNGTCVFTIGDNGPITQGGGVLANTFNSGGGSTTFGVTGGTVQINDSNLGLRIYQGAPLCFSPTSGSTACNAFFRGPAAATFVLGTDVNGAAIPQLLRAAAGITGTDVIGSGMTVAPGPGTGAAVGTQLNLNRNLVLATGTTAQSSQNAVTVCESKILSNTSATAQTIATIAGASNSAGGASFTFTATGDDGTNFDAETQTCNFSWVNKAGTYTFSGAGTPICTASATSVNSGTFTSTQSITGASPTISIKIAPTWTVIVPTTVRGFWTITNNGAGAVTCQ